MYKSYQVYNENHLRVIAYKFANKYDGLRKSHVYWIAKQLGIYPDAKSSDVEKIVRENQCGKINSQNTEYVTNKKMNENGVKAIENAIIKEGYTVKKDWKDEVMEEKQMNVWEQVDLIALMKKDYDKSVEERDSAKSEAQHYRQLIEEYEKEIEDLKDKLLVSQKENEELKDEKKELGKMQLKTVDFNKEVDDLQKRIGQYNADVNTYSAIVNELRKDVSVLQTSVNQLQEKKKKLEGVISDLIGCSKRLMNMK